VNTSQMAFGRSWSYMQPMVTRRSFLGGLCAFGSANLMPLPPSAALVGTGSSVATGASIPLAPATYKWAEMIVRAHNKCNLSMLERLLQLDKPTAMAIREQLLRNGVISTQVNRFGMHRALKPLDQTPITNTGKQLKALKDKTRVSRMNDDALTHKRSTLPDAGTDQIDGNTNLEGEETAAGIDEPDSTFEIARTNLEAGQTIDKTASLEVVEDKPIG